eukprot:CCRYP_006274-RB/>CCRYP_006274-RB protein AED:0.23 eAED:0.23 QI:173/1/1/1/1/1/2/372/747
MAVLARRRIAELSGLMLLFWMITLIRRPTQSSSELQTAQASDSYLYNTVDSSPVLDHGLDGADFIHSNYPKVVEFYDHRCGACQAFKYNYIEVAKKVQSSRPDVAFYGVSCALFPSECSVYGTRVPKIMVFHSSESEGIEVHKGSGSIYFLSERVLKALRNEDNIAAGASTIKSSVRRRLMDEGEHDDETAYDSEDVRKESGGNAGSTARPEPPQDDVINDPSKRNGGAGSVSILNKESVDDEGKDRKSMNAAAEQKWDLDKLVEIKGVPRDAWKPLHETDAWKNTMKELGNSDSNLGMQFLKWKHEHDAKLRAHAEAAEKEKDRLDSKIHRDVEIESRKFQEDGPSDKAVTQQRTQTQTKQIVIDHRDVPPPNVFPVNLDPEQEKKFKEFIEKKRQAAVRHEQLKHPVQALLGGDAKKVEPKQKEHSPMNNYKAQYNSISKSISESTKPKADLRPEAQQKSTSEKVLSKVPFVKRAFQRSHAQETLNDAALSFTRGLLMGVFKGSARGPLDYKRKTALKDWFDLLSVSLPPEMGLHELIDTLNLNIESITQSEENLKAIIEKHYIPDSNWSNSCTAQPGSLGFFCGFWKLLHIMSMGVAEQAGGLVLRESNPSLRVFSSKEAADVLREYMIYFFNCDKCVKRFVGQFDECSFQRCSRLSSETENASMESWRQFPLWLWEVHNDVSRSKAIRAVEVLESRGRKADARKFDRYMRFIYPHIDQCFTCFDNEGKWNLDAVYNHLEQEYW